MAAKGEDELMASPVKPASILPTLNATQPIAPHREGDQAQYVPPRPSDAAHANGLAPVLDWAKQHLHQPMTIRQLADRAGMSTRTFGRHFAQRIGLTPLRWLTQQRLAGARELLETTDLPIDTVAERTGLRTGNVLRQHFHRQLGTTPAAYRRTFGERNTPSFRRNS